MEAIRVLMLAFGSGCDSRTTCLNQLRRLRFCGPDGLRERLRGVTVGALAAALRPNPTGDRVMSASKLARQTLGRRVLDIDTDRARGMCLADGCGHRSGGEPMTGRLQSAR
jgi:hypothetical protein